MGRHGYRGIEAHMMTLLALNTLYDKVVFSEDDIQEIKTHMNKILDAFKSYTVRGFDRPLTTTFKSHVTSLHATLCNAGVYRQMEEWNEHCKIIQKCIISYMKQVKVLLMFTAAIRNFTCPQQNTRYRTFMPMTNTSTDDGAHCM